MNAIQSIRQGQQGSTLLNMMCFLFIALGLVFTILDVSSDHRALTVEQMNVEQAMFVAEGGCERASRFVESNLYALVMGNTSVTNGTGTIGAGTYNYYITKLSPTTYSVVSSGTVNSVTRVVQIRWLYQPTYAQFAFWAATNGAINFVAGNVFNGAVHTDDPPQFQSSGSGSSTSGAVFNARMDTLASSFNGSTNGAVFAQGFYENSYEGSLPSIDLNSSAATSMKSIAQTNGLVLYGATTITFNGNNTVNIINTRKGWTNATPYTLPNEALIYVGTTNSGSASTATGMVYFTGGTITGRVTVVSDNDMFIQGSLVYAHDPTVNTNSTDALGLVTGGDIWVDTNAPNNIVIDAAMMATGIIDNTPNSPGSFGVVNYDQGSPRGNLTLYGGIVQEVRGAVGTVNGGTISTGYNKIYSYDPRFIANPPPYYPAVAGKFQYTGWSEGH